jgi:hypothetical protein
VLDASPILKVVREAFSTIEPRPSVPGYSQMSAVVYTEVNRMLAGQQDIRTTAENIERGIEPLLRR